MDFNDADFDLDLEYRTDPSITTADGLATLDDVRSLHNIVDDGLTGEGITVAVMDSGIDDSHPVFDDVPVSHYDCTGTGVSDDSGHGTAVAGLIAQLAPDVELISVKIFGADGTSGNGPIIRAYEYLEQNADDIDVVNMSWGARRRSERLDRLHEQLLENDIQDVVAAGNTGEEGGSPSTALEAFSVGALTEDGRVTHFSSHNPNRENPDVSAIGKDVRMPRSSDGTMGQPLDHEWVKASGTSFAAPIVSALVARLMEADESHDPQEVFEAVANDIERTPRDGEGIVDYEETASLVASE